MMLLSIGSVWQPKAVSAADTIIGDDYPAKWKNLPLGATNDNWKMATRYCTSFVANRLSVVNKFDIRRDGLDWNANQWGNNAKIQGYKVDMNPKRGSVAYWNAKYHVAWVAAVDGNRVLIEEYNYDYNGNYNSRWINKNAVDGYIHFKDIKTENFPLIPNETSIMIKDKAAVFYDGTAITSADKMNGYIITGYKDIPEKYGSLRAYTIKGSNKLLYEGDVAIQTSPYPYLKNGTSVVLKQNTALDSDGKAISSEDKNKGYVIENVRDIRKKWDSIRIYKVQGLNRWFYEGDLEVQTSPYKIIPTDTSVQIKESAYFYYGGGSVANFKNECIFNIYDCRLS